ncbi:hypothetical protein BDN72DRAFT_871083 [Pluteus cervinus]|uniref:Uncharacterized protein n=1 Tax=Pluteus cervinus TaxID=181527 RepID=A0ACD3AR25_9AGAR|nr:hypothetical protein BDN72DRAFT_871083 [Pluteus cervinus]
MSGGGQPYTPPPKYITDFSKALANEVRILLDEVGKLRDERRQLQYEIAELMAVKSKHGSGGEYSPAWQKQLQAPPTMEMIPAPMPPPEEPLAPARPGWRIVHKRPERKPKAIKAAPAPVATPAPSIPDLPMQPEMPAWSRWRPNPLLQPAASPSPMVNSPPPRTGLFGPATPPPK